MRSVGLPNSSRRSKEGGKRGKGIGFEMCYVKNASSFIILDNEGAIGTVNTGAIVIFFHKI